MNKINRVLLLVLVVQAILFTGMRLGRQPPMRAQAVQVFPNLDPDKVTRIVVEGRPQQEKDDPPQNKVELTKVGATWGIATADNYPADENKVRDFLKELAKLRSTSTVLTRSTYHDKLEVSEGKFQRKITITHDGQDMTVFMGTSPSFKNVHLRPAEGDDVLLVSGFGTTDVSDRAWGWVDRTYLAHEASDVWRLKIENGAGTIELERNPQDDSWLAVGLKGTPKKSVVDDLIRKASKINLEEPVGKQDKPEYGLADPAATITLVTGTSTIAGVPPPTTETTTIRIGKKLEAENRYYVKASSSDYVVQAAGWSVSPLVDKSKKDLKED